MIGIPIRVAGDQWCNRNEVVELLQTVDKHSYIRVRNLFQRFLRHNRP